MTLWLVKWILNTSYITRTQDLLFYAFKGHKRIGFEMTLENSVLRHNSHPSRLQKVSLSLYTVLYVDQTQQVLLQEKGSGEMDSGQMKEMKQH